MNLFQRFQYNIAEQHLFSLKDKLVLAVSGGIDSVVLCELCKQAGYDFIIAHCNFQLRGEESERDEQFVKELGNKYGVEMLVNRFDTETYASKEKTSIQEAARDLRYQWFFEIVQAKMNLSTGKSTVNSVDHRCYLVTAHHADDNIETVLMNFFRGTGLNGLTGIPAIGHKRENFSLVTSYVRRPLLPFFKDDLLQFAGLNKLGFVEDSSNKSSKYTRNFFRNDILPAIRTVYPQVKENMIGNIDRFKEIDRLYNLAVGDIKRKLCRKKGAEIHIPVKQLMAFSNRALIYEIIRDFGFNEKHVDEVLKLSESTSGKYVSSPSGDYRIIRHRHWFIITSVKPELSENIVIEESDERVVFAGGMIEVEKLRGREPSTDNHIACIDLKEITYPLLLRQWKAGDYFYPLGMKKKKKLARFFIDHKLSKPVKEKMWVLEMNKKVVWVVGMRIDERFKISARTKNVLQLTFSPEAK